MVLRSASSLVEILNQFRTIKQEKKELEKEGKYKTGGVGSVYISGKAIHDYANCAN